MERLADFQPIKKLTLPGLGDLDCSGLVLIVGPNSSGKTQLLRDIKEKISGEPRDLVVATAIEIETPDQDSFLRCLKAEGYLSSIWADNDEEQFVPRTTPIGTGQSTQNVGVNTLNQWRTRSSQPAKGKRRDEYWGWLSKFLVTVLFLENRLTALRPAATIDFETQPPSNDLHALHLNDRVREALSVEVQRAFSKAIWSCTAKGNQVVLRISDDGVVPAPQDRLSIQKMAEYRTIESEGDGMKSYVYTAISILLGRRPVTVIDEPEMCLHPPQALSLGQFIGKTAPKGNTATFVATHSSHVLRGIIQAADHLQIVRLTRDGTGFDARHVRAETLAEAMRKPTVRAETVLDGIFAQAVAIVEADGDRIVYQATWEVIGGERNFDIHFATAGGTGSIADTVQLYRVLGIPVAVIADLDILTDPGRVRSILSALAEETAEVTSLTDEVEALGADLSRLPPTITEVDASAALERLATRELKWDSGDDAELVNELSDLRSALNGMRRIKGEGLLGLKDDLAKRAETIVDSLAEHGLFLVRVGELEGWLSECGLSASRKKKWAWANEAADYVRRNPEGEGDIWGFVRDVGRFLTEHFE